MSCKYIKSTAALHRVYKVIIITCIPHRGSTPHRVSKCLLVLRLCLQEISILVRDQYQYMGNSPPTPPLTQKQSIDNNLGLMLG